MAKSFHQFGLRVISGQDRSPLSHALRGVATVIEPFYAGIMRLRNRCFDRRIKHVHNLGRPTISIGNITTGGTGKTPVVLWLASQLRDRGYRPAILLRGYGPKNPGESDEQQLLDQSLNQAGSQVLRRDRLVPVRANPSRVESASELLQEDSCINVFILDDGFQHRKAKRDFDLVLINATEPFGFGHVLPRGLLREPLNGLKRASAFLITRSAQSNNTDLAATLARVNPAAPIFRSDHVQTSVWNPRSDQHVDLSSLAGTRIFVFAGIGDPEPFAAQLAHAGCDVVGRRWFADHHPYTAANLRELTDAAAQAGAAWLITTGKDWVKIATVSSPGGNIPIGVAELKIVFADGDEQALLDRMMKCLPA